MSDAQWEMASNIGSTVAMSDEEGGQGQTHVSLVQRGVV